MQNTYRAELLESKACQEGSTSGFVRAHRHRLPALEWIAVGALFFAFMVRTFVPAWQTLQSEFPNYYLAAQLYRHNIPLDRIYEWTWFQRQNDHWGVRDGIVSFAPNPPSLILASIPVTALQPLAAKRVWLILSLVFLALSLAILRQVTALSWRRLLLVSLLSLLPLHVDFLFARHYVLILFLTCAAYHAAWSGRHGLSGAIWSAAAVMKLFPVLVLILFFRNRNWRALIGFLIGLAVLVSVSVMMFGAEVHRVFLREVLSQTSRGDWLGPYALSQNSFATLWSHLFLFEPELNPSPMVHSPLLYASVQAITVTVLVCVFLWFIGNDRMPHAAALQWAALIPLMLLLCTTTAPDYWCLLIFSAILGVDALLASRNSGKALVLLILYGAACAPVPAKISSLFPTRLLATVALLGWLLHCVRVGPKQLSVTRWLAAGLISVVTLTLYGLETLRNREEDFSRRLPAPSNGYRRANPVPVASGVAYMELQPSRYGVALASNGVTSEIPLAADALSLAGSSSGTLLYSEMAVRQSLLVRLPVDQLGSVLELVTEGQEPALSSNGKWLAFIREVQGRRTAWLRELESDAAPQTVLAGAYQPLDLTVTNDGDVIAAAGKVSDPQLLRFLRNTREVIPLPGFEGPTRYPSISPDGRRLAFTRREWGIWHLFVRDLATMSERQLTHGWSNSLSPSWMDTHSVLYATDCGRGLGSTAIARVVVPE